MGFKDQNYYILFDTFRTVIGRLRSFLSTPVKYHEYHGISSR